VENFIRKYRKRAGLTQGELGEKVNTSQSQIARLEAGVQAARLDLAVAIAVAFKAPLETIFPKQPRHSVDGYSLPEEKSVEDDVALRRIAYRLRGGYEGLFIVSHDEWTRLKSIISGLWTKRDNGDHHGFIILDSQGHRIAINLNHLLYAHFLFDRDDSVMVAEEEDEAGAIRFFLSDGAALQFPIEPDEGEFGDDDKQVQFRLIFATLDGEGSSPEPVFLNFVDADGEQASVAAREVSMLSVPLQYVEPKLWKAMQEEDA
jgi:DNA-binding XRE family transcriptional regulator